MLKVYYPWGGRVFLLHWWTYDERGHLVLAPTERTLTAMAKSVFDRHPDVEIKNYCEIDVVGPSPRLQKLAADQDIRERVAAFYGEIASKMYEAVVADKPLPPIFAECETYEPGHVSGNDEWSRESHYDCKHCRHKIRLVGLTPGDLYARYYISWLAANPDHRDHDRRRPAGYIPSRAPAANDDEQIWCARADFGHHSSGIALKEVDVTEPDTFSGDGTYSHSCLDDRTLFFFKRLRDLDVSQLQAMLDEVKAGHERRRAVHEHARVAQLKQEKVEEIDAALAFFNRAP